MPKERLKEVLLSLAAGQAGGELPAERGRLPVCGAATALVCWAGAPGWRVSDGHLIWVVGLFPLPREARQERVAAAGRRRCCRRGGRP